jgi:hypothetical protein
MKFFTTVTIAASVAALMTAQAVAGTIAPLAAGKPAGVQKAQVEGSLLIPLAIGAAAVGILVAATSGGNGDLKTSPVANPPTTTSTGTTG